MHVLMQFQAATYSPATSDQPNWLICDLTCQVGHPGVDVCFCNIEICVVCLPGTHCVKGIVQETGSLTPFGICCPTGMEPCTENWSKCCPTTLAGTRSNCCGEGGSGECCDFSAGKQCCGDFCQDSIQEQCCSTDFGANPGFFVCPSNYDCCGRSCVSPDRKCCTDGTADYSCSLEEDCCNGRCCEKGSTCCGNQCVPASYGCCDDKEPCHLSDECCGASCYDPAEQACCVDAIFPYLRPFADYDCCRGIPCPAGQCINGQCIQSDLPGSLLLLS